MPSATFVRPPLGFLPRPIALALGALAVLSTAGCKSSPKAHTNDPRLRQIDELIGKQLPPGSPMSQVNSFLNSRGYPQEDAHQAHLLVATIEHVDTATLMPSAARVTFHFDPNDKLLTYELSHVPPTAPH